MHKFFSQQFYTYNQATQFLHPSQFFPFFEHSPATWRATAVRESERAAENTFSGGA